MIPEYAQTKVSNYIGNHRTFDKFFNIMSKVLAEAGIEHLTGLEEAAFYNYFLRPAYKDWKNKGFVPQNIDREVSGILQSKQCYLRKHCNTACCPSSKHLVE